MKLIAFGDSFVEGLIKEPFENTVQERDQICFVKQIADKCNYFDSYVNYGRRGSGNLSICYNVFKHIRENNYKNCFFLVCLSGAQRQDKYNKKTDRYENSGCKKEYYDIMFQTNILLAGIHQILKHKEIPHLFTSSFMPFNLFYTDVIPPKFIIGDINKCNSLFDIIAERFNTPEKLFGNYLDNHTSFNVKKTKFIADCLHPSAEGHKLIADTLTPYIYKELDNYKKDSSI